jgi:DNA-binding MarR family transcriptional regulator
MVDVNAARAEKLRESIELFYFAYRAFTEGPDQILAQRGLGRVHHRVLYFVGRNPDIAVNALLDILAVSKQALNAPLRRLMELNLISGRVDPRDRRFKRLSLTREGTKLEALLTGTQVRQLGSVFAGAGGKAETSWKKIMRALGRPP